MKRESILQNPQEGHQTAKDEKKNAEPKGQSNLKRNAYIVINAYLHV